MSMMLRSSATILVLSALAACSPPETPGRDAAADSTADTGVSQPDGSPADTGVTTDTGVPGDGGGSMTCGSAYSPCDPVSNTGCMAGQMCVIMNQAMRQSACVAAGRAAFGAACASADECAEGLGCIGGKCARWCCGIGDNATCRGMPGGRAGALCNINVTDSGLFACSLPDNCDLHQQNCMPATNACVPVGTDGTTQCVTPVMGATPGGACSSLNGCPRGHICIMAAGSMTSTCRQVCDPTMMATGSFAACPMGQTCGRISGLPANVGSCAPMM